MATGRARRVSMARKTRPIPPPPTYSTSSKCPSVSPGNTRPSKIRYANSEVAGAGVGVRPVMMVASSANNLAERSAGR